MKKALALILTVSLTVAGLCSCVSKPGKEKDEKDDDLATVYVAVDTALKTENFSFSRAEVSYAFHQNYNDFRYTDSESIDVYNIDTAKTLKDQVYYKDEETGKDVTWFDYFANMTTDYMSTILCYCEEAKALGIELSDEDLSEVEKAVQSYTTFANDYGFTESEYLSLLFNSDVDASVLRDYMKKEALGFKLYNHIVSGYSFTHEEMAKYAEENKTSFCSVDYITYTFDEDKDAGAKAAAEALAKITDSGDFREYILDYMKNTLELEEDKQNIEDCVFKYAYYRQYNDFFEWAYGDEAKENATFCDFDEVDGTYKVFLLTKTPYLHTDVTKNIRIIATDIDKYSSLDKAEERTNQIYEQWKSGEATEDSFATLAKQESHDNSSNVLGGLLEGIHKSDPALPDGLTDWLYSDEIAAGDTRIFSTTGYFYIVYFVGDNDVKWEKDVRDTLVYEKYSEYEKSLLEKYSVEKFDEVIYSLEG
ncbi:MAG: hypothetical protein E7575_04685 [Ruminococcaceae bacterium]|nr:hypothetical protein [Oscillospiraceae bacterium]